MTAPQNPQGDATRIIAAIQDRINRSLKNNAAVELTWGSVASVAANQKSASAYLYGSSTYTADDLRLPEAGYVTVGDIVKVATSYETDERWIEEIYYPPSAFKKIALDLKTGSLLQGDGTAAPIAQSFALTGEIKGWPVAAIPAGYLLCNGQSVLRATYPALFALIGTTYGSADGTHFNVPNLSGKFPLGVDGSHALASTGGTIDHVHTGPSHTHTGPSHTHTGPSHTHSHNHAGLSHQHTLNAHTHGTPDHQHTGTTTTDGGAQPVAGSGNNRAVAHNHTFTTNVAEGSGTTDGGTGGSVGATAPTTDTDATAGGTGATGSGGTGATGSDGTQNTGTANPPYIAINWIIKT